MSFGILLEHRWQYMGEMIWFMFWQGKNIELSVQQARWVPDLAWSGREQKTLCTLLSFFCLQYTYMSNSDYIYWNIYSSKTTWLISFNDTCYFLVTEATMSTVAKKGACLGQANGSLWVLKYLEYLILTLIPLILKRTLDWRNMYAILIDIDKTNSKRRNILKYLNSALLDCIKNTPLTILYVSLKSFKTVNIFHTKGPPISRANQLNPYI